MQRTLPANPDDRFKERYARGDAQLLTIRLPADLETPVSAALKLLQNEQYSYLLESVAGGESRARYSFLGWAPDLLWRVTGSQAETAQFDGAKPLPFRADNGDALKSLNATIQSAIVPESGDVPAPVAGLVGYLGYDMVRLVETLPKRPEPYIDLPDSMLIRPTLAAVFDSVTDMLTLIAIVRPKADVSAQKAYITAKTALEDATRKLAGPVPPLPGIADKEAGSTLSRNVSADEFCAWVERTKEFIEAGDIFQVVLSQRFSKPFPADSFWLYRSLRRINPAPFLFHLRLGEASLVGSSPEILVRVREGSVTIRPIAGTRPRGATQQEDNALAQSLLSDPKERAEHLMLLDLGRNDVGRAARPGTVKVTEQFQIERYSHVMHIVSNVEGEIDKNKPVSEALFSGFPAGTVSGAPKVRAMEIIDHFERDGRGPYAGAVGYFGVDGDMDSCIVLRTALIKDGIVHVQAGAGIVADSDPAAENQECENKAAALLKAAEDALEHARAALA